MVLGHLRVTMIDWVKAAMFRFEFSRQQQAAFSKVNHLLVALLGFLRAAQLLGNIH